MPINYYIKATHQVIQLQEKPFASGGEGALHQVLRPNTWSHCVAKIIYPSKRTPQKEAKLGYLLANPPYLEANKEEMPISWVQELLHDKEGNFVGFLMPRATGEKLEILTAPKLPKHLGPEWQRLRLGGREALGLRLKICYNIALAVHLLHATKRYVLVDMKPDNLLIKSNGVVSIVDLDSVEIVEGDKTLFAATVATPEYTPSEYYKGVRPGQVMIDTSWDNFGLAVIFYRLLFGLHPFAGTAEAPYDRLTSLGDKIKAGLFVHNPQHQAAFKVIPPPHQVFYQQEKPLQALFQQAFTQGHEQPQARPHVMTWAKVIANHSLLLTARELPSKRLALDNLEQKDWYKAAVEQARQSKLPAGNVFKKFYSSTVRKSFRQKLEDNMKQLWGFTKELLRVTGIVYVIVLTVVIILVLMRGIEQEAYLISAYVELTWLLLQVFIKSPFFILFLFFPLGKAVFSEAKEVLFDNSTWQQKKDRNKTQSIINKPSNDLKERQYNLYTERSRLRNKVRELKNEYYVYLKVKEQKEAAFGEEYKTTIASASKKIKQQVQSKKAALAEKDQQAHVLIQQEAQEIRALAQQQQQELAADPIFKTIRGKNSRQKLLFLQQDPPSWEDKSISKETVHQALKKIYQDQELAKVSLKKAYDAAHNLLLEAVEEEKISIDTLVGTSVQGMRERIQIDELLFDKAFVETLARMKELQGEIEEKESNLEQVKFHLEQVKEQLK